MIYSEIWAVHSVGNKSYKQIACAMIDGFVIIYKSGRNQFVILISNYFLVCFD